MIGFVRAAYDAKVARRTPAPIRSNLRLREEKGFLGMSRVVKNLAARSLAAEVCPQWVRRKTKRTAAAP
jgi:hypothetical protein